jgi:hypothetical protein
MLDLITVVDAQIGGMGRPPLMTKQKTLKSDPTFLCRDGPSWDVIAPCFLGGHQIQPFYQSLGA